MESTTINNIHKGAVTPELGRHRGDEKEGLIMHGRRRKEMKGGTISDAPLLGKRSPLAPLN
jgi:hypothetical protein